MDRPMEESRGEPNEPREGEAEAPNDVGPPQPASDKWLGTVGKTMIAVGLGGVTFFAIIGAGSRRTWGAPASAKLELKRRRAEAERAIAEADRARAGIEDEHSVEEGPRE